MRTQPRKQSRISFDAESSYKKRNFQKAIEKFTQLLNHFEESQDTQKIADITFRIGRSNRRLVNFTEALKLLHRAMKVHPEIGDQEVLGFDLIEIAIAHQQQGEYDESMRWSLAVVVNDLYLCPCRPTRRRKAERLMGE